MNTYLKVLNLKQRSGRKIRVDPERLLLVKEGINLDNNKTLEHYGIKPGDTIHSITRLRGGILGGGKKKKRKKTRKKRGSGNVLTILNNYWSQRGNKNQNLRALQDTLSRFGERPNNERPKIKRPTIDYFQTNEDGVEYYNDVSDFIRILEAWIPSDLANNMNKTTRELAHIIILLAYFPTMDINEPRPGIEWEELFTMRNRLTNPTRDVLPNPAKYYRKKMSIPKKERKALKLKRKKATNKKECDDAKGVWYNDKECVHPDDRRLKKGERRKTRKKRGNGPAMSRYYARVEKRGEAMENASHANKKFKEKFNAYMNQHDKLPSKEKKNEWVKQLRKDVFHPDGNYYTQGLLKRWNPVPFKPVKDPYQAKMGGKRRRKRKSKKKKRRKSRRKKTRRKKSKRRSKK